MLAAIANTFANCFKIPELKSRIVFTLLLLGICRVIAYIPVPGLDASALRAYFDLLRCAPPPVRNHDLPQRFR